MSGVHLSAFVFRIGVFIVVLIIAELVLAVAIGVAVPVRCAVAITAVTTALVFATLFVDQADDTEIMLGVLKVTLCRDTVSGSLGITR